MRRRKHGASWLTLGMETALLAAEAQQVIALRLHRLARGGAAARRESVRMVAEKVAAAAEAQRLLLAGTGSRDKGMGKVVRHYRKQVAGNRKRLTKGRT